MPKPEALSFLWGAATSAHQVEGYNESSDWWHWETLGKVEGGARSGPATDHRNRFSEDLRLASELGLNSYRFSIEWARIEPEEGRFDKTALQWYSDLIAECEKRNLLPMATLHHFTSPQWFAEQGGFISDKAPEQFSKYVSKVAHGLGAHVPLWCTINEPMVLVVGSYLGQFMPPGEFSPKKASLACHHLLDSHARAYGILHSEIKSLKGPWKDRKLEVGIAHNMLQFQPDRWWHPMDQFLSRVFHRFYNRSWLDAVTGGAQSFGIPGLLPKPGIVRRASQRRTVDFIGVNYYTKGYVQWHPRTQARERPSDLPFGISFARRKEPASELGWAIHPRGLGNMIRLAASYGIPVYVTENGIADQSDHIRSDYLRSHIEEVVRAKRDGIDVRGYYYWSLLDNFEWIKGFGPRFGLYHVDYETFKRTPRDSAMSYKKLIASHKF